MKIIPAIDIIGGKCIRLTQGDYNQSIVYSEYPLQIAQQFEAAGLTQLHLVDLDGARSKQIVNHETLKQITTNTKLLVDFGGGIKSDNDIQLAFDNGANQVTVGSMAITSSSITVGWINKYGTDKIIIGADVTNGYLSINGWQQQSNVLIDDFLDFYRAEGVEYIICTDISKDGMMNGPGFELYEQILSNHPTIKLIASGGISSMDDLFRLQGMNIYGAIIGKALYEGIIDLAGLKQFVEDAD